MYEYLAIRNGSKAMHALWSIVSRVVTDSGHGRPLAGSRTRGLFGKTYHYILT